MPTLPPPPQDMSATQWLIFVGIIAAFTVAQSFVLHRKIDGAKAPAKNDENPS